jgi:hypothetical protein
MAAGTPAKEPTSAKVHQRPSRGLAPKAKFYGHRHSREGTDEPEGPPRPDRTFGKGRLTKPSHRDCQAPDVSSRKPECILVEAKDSESTDPGRPPKGSANSPSGG